MKSGAAANIMCIRNDGGDDRIDIDQRKVLMTCDATTLGYKGVFVARRHFILVLICAPAGRAGLRPPREPCEMTAIALQHPEPVGCHTLRGVFPYHSGELESMFTCFEREEQENWL